MLYYRIIVKPSLRVESLVKVQLFAPEPVDRVLVWEAHLFRAAKRAAPRKKPRAAYAFHVKKQNARVHIIMPYEKAPEMVKRRAKLIIAYVYIVKPSELCSS